MTEAPQNLNEQQMKQVAEVAGSLIEQLEARMVDVYLLIKNRAALKWSAGIVGTVVLGLFGGTLVLAWNTTGNIKSLTDKILDPVPVGTILAWHKNPNQNDRNAELVLPTGWMECDGRKLPDDSPLSQLGAKHTPNLNSADGYKGGRFLRGGRTSGSPQESTEIPYLSGEKPNCVMALSKILQADRKRDLGKDSRYCNSTYNSGGGTVHAIRPVNMSVVWIIRVK